MKEYLNNLKPFHLMIFGTVFILLPQTVKNNIGLEIAYLIIALFIFSFGLYKIIKKK